MFQHHSQVQAPGQKHQPTAHLTHTMTLLGLSAAELQQHIESELSNNPALELVHEKRCPTCNRRLRMPGPCPKCTMAGGNGADDPVIFVSTREDYYFYGEPGTEDLPIEDTSPIVDDLASYVLRQIGTELRPEDRLIAATILTSLDEKGLLPTPLFEIARYHHVSIAEVERILAIIQRADPVGVGSKNSQEALLVQLEVLAETEPVPPLAGRAIEECWNLLSHRRYNEIGKLLGISSRAASQIARFIKDSLNPFPSQAHWGSARKPDQPGPNVYQRPDVIISHMNGESDGPLRVEIMLPLRGSLRVSSLFKEALKEAPPEKLEEYKSSIESANLLVKCLRQRNHTMVRLMRELVKLQQKFILKGNQHLSPTTRAQIARELDVHESTISRAVSNKCTQLPNGRIIPLSQFFDRSLHIRTALKQIIAEETRPLSDTQLAGHLKDRGYKVARRTVAKYRSMEGILPAHLRNKNRSTADA